MHVYLKDPLSWLFQAYLIWLPSYTPLLYCNIQRHSALYILSRTSLCNFDSTKLNEIRS
jgi:hypothetical protein